MTPAEFKSLRASVVDLVLATDLVNHFAIVNDFKARSLKVLANPHMAVHTFESGEDKAMLYRILVKLGDVSNAARPLPLYATWVLRIRRSTT